MKEQQKQQPLYAKPSTLEIKVYLRFNSYIYTDLLNNKSLSPITIIVPSSPTYITTTPKFQLVNTLSPTLLTGSTVIGTYSSSSSQTTTSNINQGINEQNFNHSETYNELYSLITQFKWYLNDEILQKRELLTNLNDFNQYIQHISEGLKRKCIHCEYKQKEITFNSLANNQMQNVEQLSTEQIKFKSEFLELIHKLDKQFHNCQLQKLDEYNYYLNCTFNNNKNQAKEFESNEKATEDGNQDLANTFKILIHIKDNTNNSTSTG